MHDHFEHCRSHGPRGVFRIAAMVIGGVVVASLFALVFGWLVMLLWNWLMPMLFGLKAITYWQGFGIIILSKLIFGGLCGHAKHRGPPLGGRYHHPWSVKDKSFFEPGGDRRNWVYYREYWKERGKDDFEKYLRETGHAGEEKGGERQAE
jgi:hypothetical protein